ncbi:diguanylate cyclase [Brucella pseudogrignonensis]|nr:diguanylate cyclase [Brucella pseudogrignonensis]
MCSNARGEVTFWNKSAERLFGYSAEEIIDKSTEVIVPESWMKIYEAEIDRLRQGGRMELADKTIELSGLRKDGTEFPAEISLSTWQEGNTTSVGSIVRDITERRQNEERLFRLASIDALTDLPNRGAWRECLQQALEVGQTVTVLLLDLDGFKDVNDTLGHSAGDAVLKDVAIRLKATCENAIMVARLGGDEFVALLPGNDERYAEAIAAQLALSISDTYEFGGQHIEIGVSIGVALSPQHSVRSEEMLGAADLALYRAKAAGKGRYEMFAPALREVAVARRAFEQELKEAFENDQFELFYQPQFSTADRSLTGGRGAYPMEPSPTRFAHANVFHRSTQPQAIGS